MIKFFRHIRLSLLSGSRTTKYLLYAIGEILLVVVGILIALQINNWNENRKERSEEVKTLLNIKSEFQNAVKECEENNVFRKRIIATTGEFYKIIHSSKHPFSKRQLDSMMSILFINPTYNNQSETLNILFNSGKINIISSDAIKKALVLWPQQIEDIVEDEIYASNIVYNRLQPLLMQYLSIYDINNALQFKRYELFNYNTESTFTSDYDGLFKNIEFEGALSTRELPLSVSLLQTRELISSAKNVIKLIDEDIKNL